MDSITIHFFSSKKEEKIKEIIINLDEADYCKLYYFFNVVFTV